MLRKTIHIVLVILLLAATTGITLSMHYCGGKLVSASVNSETRSCCNMVGCCEDITFHIEVKDKYVEPLIADDCKIVEKDLLTPVFFIFNDINLQGSENSVIEYKHPPPAKISKNILSFFQTFLC
ncbi:MAG: hypothetical protein JW894_01050 [Bacteroidales bacterium]|nr:hypothetical protein [Bacteroidales bacterium]